MINFQQLSDSDRERLAREAVELIGFRSEHIDKTYPKSFDDVSGKSFNSMMRQVAQAGKKGRPNSILLAGAVGAGKSSLLAAFAKTVFNRYALWSKENPDFLPLLFSSKSHYCTHTELSRLWEHEFDDNPGFMDPETVTQARVLFLDDVGTAPENVSGRNIAKLEELIDYRWGNHLKTFIATNLNPEALMTRGFEQWNRIARRLLDPEWMFTLVMPHKYGQEPKQKEKKK